MKRPVEQTNCNRGGNVTQENIVQLVELTRSGWNAHLTRSCFGRKTDLQELGNRRATIGTAGLPLLRSLAWGRGEVATVGVG